MTIDNALSHLPIRTRLLGFFAVFFLLMVAVEVFSVKQMDTLQEARGKVIRGTSDDPSNRDHFQQVLLAQQCITLVNENARRAFELFLISSPKVVDQEQFDRIYAEQVKTTHQITALYADFERGLETIDEQQAFAHIKAARADYVTTRTKVEQTLKSGQTEVAMDNLRHLMLPKLAVYLNAWRDLISLERHLTVVAEQAATKKYRWTRDVLLSLLGVSILGAGFIAIGITREFTSSLRRIGIAARRIAGGEFDMQIPVTANDEIGELARAFNAMANALQASYGQIMTQQRELEERVAARTQELTIANTGLTELNTKLAFAHGQLVGSEKLASLGQMAAGVAHEINNPVGYVASNFGTLENYLTRLFDMLSLYEAMEAKVKSQDDLTILQAKKQDIEFEFIKSDILDLMRESRDGIQRVREIVQNLKDFAHVDRQLNWEWTDLHKGIDSTVTLASNEIKYKADIVKEYSDLPLVECVLSQLNQVFLNLLVNAAHAMGEERGLIRIRTAVDGDNVQITIADNGCGIPPENLSHIFEPFFTTKPVGKGTGLGLSVSYGIIQSHHGRIDVESEVGQGTSFRITLPIGCVRTEAK